MCQIYEKLFNYAYFYIPYCYLLQCYCLDLSYFFYIVLCFSWFFVVVLIHVSKKREEVSPPQILVVVQDSQMQLSAVPRGMIYKSVCCESYSFVCFNPRNCKTFFFPDVIANCKYPFHLDAALKMYHTIHRFHKVVYFQKFECKLFLFVPVKG